MSTLEIYKGTLSALERLFHRIASHVAPPQRVPVDRGFVFRSSGQTLEEAALQKLARTVSGLHAAVVLLEHGFVQELGALERMLDECEMDILFLTQPLLGQERTNLHDRFLREFFQEEFDNPSDVLASTQKRDRIPRSKIRAAVARMTKGLVDPGRLQELHRTIDNAHSGFVHGASTHILDLYGGNPPHFYVSGMRDTPKVAEQTDYLWNYFHRGIISLEWVAFALGVAAVAEAAAELGRDFQRKSERDC